MSLFGSDRAPRGTYAVCSCHVILRKQRGSLNVCREPLKISIRHLNNEATSKAPRVRVRKVKKLDCRLEVVKSHIPER